MRFELKEVSICADKEFELIRITDPVREFVEQTGVKNGVVYVITEHTTTGIMVNESLPCVEKGYYGDAEPDRAGRLSLPS